MTSFPWSFTDFLPKAKSSKCFGFVTYEIMETLSMILINFKHVMSGNENSKLFFFLPMGFCPLIWHWKVTCCPCLAFVTDGGCLTKYKHPLSFIFVDISLVIESTISFCFLLTFPLSIVPPETRPVMLFLRCGKTEYSVYSRSFCWPPSRLG